MMADVSTCEYLGGFGSMPTLLGVLAAFLIFAVIIMVILLYQWYWKRKEWSDEA